LSLLYRFRSLLTGYATTVFIPQVMMMAGINRAGLMQSIAAALRIIHSTIVHKLAIHDRHSYSGALSHAGQRRSRKKATLLSIMFGPLKAINMPQHMKLERTQNKRSFSMSINLTAPYLGRFRLRI
jgi:hypothetical protein